MCAGSELLREIPGREAVAPILGETAGDWELKTVLESRDGIGPKGERRFRGSSAVPSQPATLGVDWNPLRGGR